MQTLRKTLNGKHLEGNRVCNLTNVSININFYHFFLNAAVNIKEVFKKEIIKLNKEIIQIFFLTLDIKSN